MKLVPPEDLGFQELKVSECRKLSIQTLFSFLMLGMSQEWVAPTEKTKNKKKNLFELTKTSYALCNASEHALLFFEMYTANEHVYIHEFNTTW